MIGRVVNAHAAHAVVAGTAGLAQRLGAWRLDLLPARRTAHHALHVAGAHAWCDRGCGGGKLAGPCDALVRHRVNLALVGVARQRNGALERAENAGIRVKLDLAALALRERKHAALVDDPVLRLGRRWRRAELRPRIRLGRLLRPAPELSPWVGHPRTPACGTTPVEPSGRMRRVPGSSWRASLGVLTRTGAPAGACTPNSARSRLLASGSG